MTKINKPRLVDDRLIKSLAIDSALELSREQADFFCLRLNDLLSYCQDQLAGPCSRPVPASPLTISYQDLRPDRPLPTSPPPAAALKPEPALAGLAFTASENICSLQLKTGAASPILEGYQPSANAWAVDLLLEAGASLQAKTELAEFALATRPGRAVNPHDPDHYAGRAGGAAQALIRGQAQLALADTTNGGLLQTASYCGLTGLVPTRGLISRQGLISATSSLSGIGILAKRAAHMQTALGLLLQADPASWTKDKKKLKDSRLALLLPADQPLGDPLKSALEELGGDLVRAGMDLTIVQDQLTEAKPAVHYTIMAAEAASYLARYRGWQLSPSSKDGFASYNQLVSRQRSQLLGQEVKETILAGNFMLRAQNIDNFYQKALAVRSQLAASYRQVLASFDYILQPVTMTRAPSLTELTAQDNLSLLKSDPYLFNAALAGLPAISLPWAKDQAGLPLGLQLIGRPAADLDLLQAVMDWQDLIGDSYVL